MGNPSVLFIIGKADVGKCEQQWDSYSYSEN